MHIENLPSEQQENPQDSCVILLRDVYVRLGGFELNIPSFGIRPNSIEAVIGPNGAGKTTLCDVISGKTNVTSGRVLFEGQDITEKSETEIAEIGVGRKFQTPSVFDSLTVFQNLELMLPGRTRLLANFRTRTAAAQTERIYSTLVRFGLMPLERTLARYLSHGQRQWLELAMLVVKSPRLLLVDEPAAGLTDKETDATVEILKDLSKDHAVVVIEHDMDFIRQLGANVTVMHNGRDIAYGSYTDVWRDERVREVYQLRTDAAGSDAATIKPIISSRISINNLAFSYGNVEVLHGVSMEIPTGQVTALLGRNGAGKSTLLRNITGTLSPLRGSVSIEDIAIDRMRAHERARLGIAFVPQGRGIFPQLSIEENLLLGLENGRKKGFSINERLYTTFPWMRRDAQKRAGDLSGGQQQQLAIARALVGKPRVLLLDEPTDGIDAITENEIILLIQKLASGTSPLIDEPVTILIVEQNIGFVRKLASQFYILERGCIVNSGVMGELTVEVIAKYLGD